MDFGNFINMTSKVDGTTTSNMSMHELTRLIDGYSFDAKLVCSKTNDVSQNVVRPIMEAGIQKFLNVCAMTGETLLPTPWSLCDKHRYFDCSGIYSYTTQCSTTRLECNKVSNSVPASGPVDDGHGKDGFRMEMLMEDPGAIALLVCLVLLGLLIGVALTIAVCLIWPNIHMWANSKLRPEKSVSGTSIARGDSVYTSSNSYYEIDDKMREAVLPYRSHSSVDTSPSWESHSTSSSSRKPRPPPLRHFNELEYNTDPCFRSPNYYGIHSMTYGDC